MNYDYVPQLYKNNKLILNLVTKYHFYVFIKLIYLCKSIKKYILSSYYY